MSNLMTSFNAGVSGLQSAQASLNTTSHNLANANTKGYTRQQIIVTDSFYQNSYGATGLVLQIGTGTTIAQTRQIRNTFLDSQYRLQLGRQGFYQANSDASVEIEDMLGELQGEEFSTSISDLWTALSSLANEAENIVYKDDLVSVASQFVERAQVLQNELNTYQTSLNQEVKKQVQAINDIVSQIKDLNKKIQKYEATGESANDYRDKRNDLLDSLSGYIKFEVNEEKDGTITLYAEGAYLLDTDNQYFLTTKNESATSKLLKPIWESGGDFFLNDSLSFSTSNNSDVGSLRGLLVARGNAAANYTSTPTKPKQADYTDADGVVNTVAYNTALEQYKKDLEAYNGSVGASVIMSVQSQLDTLVHGIVTAVNDVLCPNKKLTLSDGTKIQILDEENALIGDDENSTMGTELFSRRNCDRYTKTTVSVIQEDGSVGTMDVYQYNEEDKSDMYSLYSIGQLVVNPVVLQDSSTIPVKYNNESGNKEGYANKELLGIANSFKNNIGTLNPNSLTTYNVFDFYNGMVGELGTQGNVWDGIIKNQESTVTTLDNERQSVMGVSSEEELANLIKYQQCYNASSRYVTTVSEMLEYLIERLGG